MSERLNEYFAREASEYLEQLDRLLGQPGVPDPEQILRLARGVRGSAQMGGVQTIAGVAERLEDAARSVISHHIMWSEEFRQLALQTVRDLQLLIRALNRWGPDEEARVRHAIGRWDDLDADPVVPIEQLFFDDAGPHVLDDAEPADGEVVPIESLLFRGPAALREALRLRAAVQRALDAGVDPRPLLDEVFELIELASESGTAPA